MTRIHQIAAGIFLLSGAVVVYLSLELNYYSADFGPGPGFFSFWLGILLMATSLVDIVNTHRQPQEPLPQGFIPDGGGVRRILSIVGALGAVLCLIKPLGFNLTVFLFSIFLLRSTGRQAWWATVVISLSGSLGTFYLFRQLQVFLPTGFLGF